VQHAILGLRLAIARHDRATAFSALRSGCSGSPSEAEQPGIAETTSRWPRTRAAPLGHQLLDDSRSRLRARNVPVLPVNRAPVSFHRGCRRRSSSPLVADARRRADHCDAQRHAPCLRRPRRRGHSLPPPSWVTGTPASASPTCRHRRTCTASVACRTVAQDDPKGRSAHSGAVAVAGPAARGPPPCC
jgi:hypothetical protein